ncbi:hypothetical protein N7532_005195 [Penicillium argentinense]|uniref:Mitochondrial carrier protein pet8 n=1 Tax=Penicillium argentinense TaxID=1131581 RepID=A0A9W9FDP2_9EURO|nr:uncharacterized protein N7532_005195 [Penicillium argentinense]KAJ5098194.1 hypothetical protein N7532_005195 [Penicillium argentinense]
MSFLPSIRANARRVAQGTALRPTISTFHTSASRSTLKESDKNRDDLPNLYESQKESQVKKSKEGKGHWDPSLASNSEADIKADRGELGGGDKAFQELQQKEKAKKGKVA